MNVLGIRNLNVTFGTEGGPLRALRNVSFDVPRHRIVGVVGESGCGKSTLINAILGLLADNGQVESGQILFEERDLTQMDSLEMQAMRGSRISTVFQDPMGALNPVISVGKQMLHIQYRSDLGRTEKNARSVEMLRRVRIPDPKSALSRYPHEFSGGMKQRIAIAMAMMMEPVLLIADEPTTALDATLEVATIELLQELQAQIGCSVLFISHHLGVIAELCDDVVVMYAGEVVERGTTRQIFHDPLHPYTERLLRCDPAGQSTRTRHLPTIPGEIPDLRDPPKGCIFADRCDRRETICETAPPEVEMGGHRACCHRVKP
ncbi:MAG: ABC transporter ATP-binding protein [Gammaproteobacteria bacterium]|nr:ABC transporter ATP-binding protein [Gammaproteobacteria bacterium]MYD75262.1 ABC transporter ATP-binding protein [Gammaproteobacteria bacterium]